MVLPSRACNHTCSLHCSVVRDCHVLQPLATPLMALLSTAAAHQLPNMPREYICRLLFDRRHRSVALVSRNSTVVAGITYRVFPQQVSGR